VAVDSAGNIYIADTANQVIRKVDASGHISTVAGTPDIPGYSGDGGAGTSALLNVPRAVAMDSAGNVYIADAGNNRIRMLSPGGIITTFAGNGSAGFAGDLGAATGAELNFPSGVTVDSNGNVYISDSRNNRVRRVDHSTHVIATVAGDGSPGALNYPFGLSVDSAGDLYIADAGNSRVRLVYPGGHMETVIGACGGVADFSGDGGLAAPAHVDLPTGVAAGSNGDLYIADVNNNRIRGANGLADFRVSTCTAPPGGASARTGSNPSPANNPAPRMDALANSITASRMFEPVRSPRAAHLPAASGSSSAPPRSRVAPAGPPPGARSRTGVAEPGGTAGNRPAAALSPDARKSATQPVAGTLAPAAAPIGAFAAILGLVAARRRSNRKA
jgi:sugar lactone lactonase YvrE